MNKIAVRLHAQNYEVINDTFVYVMIKRSSSKILRIHLNKINSNKKWMFYLEIGCYLLPNKYFEDDSWSIHPINQELQNMLAQFYKIYTNCTQDLVFLSKRVATRIRIFTTTKHSQSIHFVVYNFRMLTYFVRDCYDQS